ncbi:MAG: hypothetical protein CBC48_13805 [bacterium TMED88]|nr:hypothetical protein [Deltaproteobacteria bacterium]OUV27934.1 MAG: hypothetical protein CBC48_13805 [bacterium TMED88]
MRSRTSLFRSGPALGLWAVLAVGCASTGKPVVDAPETANQAVQPLPAPLKTPSTAEANAQAAPPATPPRAPTPPPPPPPQPAAPVQIAAVAPPSTADLERFPEVTLAQFTTGVENREPMDAVSFVGNDVAEIYFYSDLRDLSGATVVHRWEYGGEVMAEVPFEVTTDRWQVWSTKALSPNQLGDWTVSVVAPDGEILAVETFSYQRAR